jgi:hypothetical protein
MEESQMFGTTRALRPQRISRVLAVAGVAALAVGGTFLTASTAGATTSTIVHITAVSPHLVSALTANQVITVTGSGFDESVISGVAVAGCTAPSYIVQSPTVLLVKTDTTCAAAANVVVTVTDTSGTAVSVPGATGGAQALSFVTAPTIAVALATLHPVTTDNTAGLTYAAQTTAGTSASTKGGTVVRVTSGATGYSNSTSLPLAASLDGVALTGVKLVGTNGTAGNYFTGVVGAHAADAAPVLKITNNGVSKSFVWGAGGSSPVAGTFDFVYGGSTVAVSPAFGPANGGTKLTIAGAGFSTTGSNDVVTVGGVACPLTTPAPTATTIVCTAPASTLAGIGGPVTVQVAVTGGLTSVISAGSTFTYLAQ